jgi:hypothetical protein
MTNIIAYFYGGARVEVDVDETLEQVTTELRTDAMAIFTRKRGGAVVINPARTEYILLSEGEGE